MAEAQHAKAFPSSSRVSWVGATSKRTRQGSTRAFPAGKTPSANPSHDPDLSPEVSFKQIQVGERWQLHLSCSVCTKTAASPASSPGRLQRTKGSSASLGQGWSRKDSTSCSQLQLWESATETGMAVQPRQQRPGWRARGSQKVTLK